VNLQNVVVAQRTNTGDSLIELDSPGDEQPTPGNAQPATSFQVNNFTFVQRSSASSHWVICSAIICPGDIHSLSALSR
ncbi:MAG: hypothetical protein AAFO68_01215, partial [Pseudomonadota bacterium]